MAVAGLSTLTHSPSNYARKAQRDVVTVVIETKHKEKELIKKESDFQLGEKEHFPLAGSSSLSVQFLHALTLF